MRPALFVSLLCCGLVCGAQAEPLLAAIAPTGQASAPAPWHLTGLPHQSKPFTQFRVEDHDGKRALRVESDHAYGNLEHPLKGMTDAKHLAWQWQIAQPLRAADIRERAREDVALRVCALFDLSNDHIPFGERVRLYAARAASNEPVPGATVCYVWDNHLAPGTVADSPYTRRIRYIVLRGPESPANQWRSEERDVAADFQRLYGDESKEVPPLVGVIVGADTDNTGEHSLGFVSELSLAP